MAVNKVTFAGNTLIDLTADTRTSPDQLVTGAKAHTKSGAPVTGTNPYEKAATDAAVNNALTALAEKGVTLGGSEGVGDLATLIAAIEAGGGGSVGPTITVTPATTDVMYFTIENITQKKALLWCASDGIKIDGTNEYEGVAGAIILPSSSTQFRVYIHNSRPSMVSMEVTKSNTSISATSVTNAYSNYGTPTLNNKEVDNVSIVAADANARGLRVGKTYNFYVV